MTENFAPRPRRRWLKWAIWIVVLIVVGFAADAAWKVHAVLQKVWRIEHVIQLKYDLSIYASRHGDTLPPDLRTLLADGSGRPWSLASESHGDTPATGPTTRELLEDFDRPGHLSYAYLGAGLSISTVPPDAVIAYEIPSPATDQTTVVLFGDDRVEFLNRWQTEALLQAVSATTRPVRFSIPN